MCFNKRILICNFTGVYEAEGITALGDVLDFTDLPGTNMYIDDEAESEIRRRIASLCGCHKNDKSTAPIANPHEKYKLRFLDNGNYHYMTRILASYINEPFELITFDNHTDDQPPAFEGIKSCGSWRRDIMSENKNLRQSMLVQSYEDFPSSYIPSELPLYISIDKDILSENVLTTNWDQGSMTENELFGLLEKLIKTRNILAIDVCGEDVPENPCLKNEIFNKKIINNL